MRIYTRTGDAGETGLFGGQRVWKDVLRVEAEDSPGLGGSAALAQRAPAAGRLELGLAGAVSMRAAQVGSAPGRAGGRASLIIDDEVVNGEARRDGRPQRGRFDHHRMTVCLEAFAQFPGSVGGIAEDGYQ